MTLESYLLQTLESQVTVPYPPAMSERHLAGCAVHLAAHDVFEVGWVAVRTRSDLRTHQTQRSASDYHGDRVDSHRSRYAQVVGIPQCFLAEVDLIHQVDQLLLAPRGGSHRFLQIEKLLRTYLHESIDQILECVMLIVIVADRYSVVADAALVCVGWFVDSPRPPDPGSDN